MLEKLNKGHLAKDSPAIILTKAEHEEISAILSAKRKILLDETGGKPSKEQVWAMYKEVYKHNPNWLKAIEHYFQ